MPTSSSVGTKEMMIMEFVREFSKAFLFNGVIAGATATVLTHFFYAPVI